MSAPAEEKTRAESAREKMEKRVGKCVVCKCEKYEFSAKLDGYDTCVCDHTQWGHTR